MTLGLQNLHANTHTSEPYQLASTNGQLLLPACEHTACGRTALLQLLQSASSIFAQAPSLQSHSSRHPATACKLFIAAAQLPSCSVCVCCFKPPLYLQYTPPLGV